MKLPHLLFLMLINLAWGSNVVVTKLVLLEIGPVTAAFLRFVLVFLTCGPWLRWVPGRMPLVVVTSLVAGVGFLTFTNASFAVADNISAIAIASQLGVPFSLILAVIFFRERVSWVRGTGVALALAGIGFMSFDPAIVGERLGLMLTVVACLFWATGSLLFRKLNGVAPLTIYAWLSLVSVPVLLGLSLLLEPGELAKVPDAPPSIFGWIALSAFGSTVLGHVGMAWLLQRYPVSIISPLTLPSPLISVAAAIIIFDTPITARMLVGGLLALAGITIITVRSARRREEEKPHDRLSVAES